MPLGDTLGGPMDGFSCSADTKCLLWGMLESELDGFNGLLPPLTKLQTGQKDGAHL